jgi:O-antigen/teichoic acid export membrane protein
LSNKNKFLRNLLSIGIIDGLNIIIPFITLPILTRSLGIEVYGTYFVFLNLIFFGHTLIDYGVHYRGVRDVAQATNLQDKQALYGHYQYLRYVNLAIYVIILFLYDFIFLSSKFSSIIGFACFPYFLGYVLMGSWFYLAISQTKIIVISNIISKLVNLILILIFVSQPEDLNIAIFSFSLPILFAGIMVHAYGKKTFQIPLMLFGRYIEFLRSGFNIFISLLLPNFYNSLPIIYLGTNSDASEFSKFAVATRLCELIITAQSILSKSIFPILSTLQDNYLKKLLIGNLLIFVPIVIFVFFFGDLLIEVYLGGGFISDFPIVEITSIGIFALTVATGLGQGYLIPKGFDHLYRNAIIKTSILGGGLTFMLIFYFSIIGAVFGVLLSRFLLLYFSSRATFLSQQTNELIKGSTK